MISDEIDLQPCPHCGQRYEVIFNVSYAEPIYCPFCGEEILNDE